MIGFFKKLLGKKEEEKRTEERKVEKVLPKATPSQRSQRVLPKDEPSVSFANPFVQEIWEELKRYWWVFEGQKADKLTLALLKIYDKYGDCPSVVKHKQDEVWKKLSHVFENVSLSEHVRDVMKKAIELLKQEYKDVWYHLLPRVALMVLGHDVGKAEGLREILKTKFGWEHEAHYAISAQLLLSLDIEKPSYIKEVISAVLYHHTKTKDKWLWLLQKADRLARDEELRTKGKIRGYWELSKEELLKGIFDALRQGRGIVDDILYLAKEDKVIVSPSFASRIAFELLLQKGVFEEDFMKRKGFEKLFRIVGAEPKDVVFIRNARKLKKKMLVFDVPEEEERNFKLTDEKVGFVVKLV